MQNRFRTILKLTGINCLSAFSVFLSPACGLGLDEIEGPAGILVSFDAGGCGTAMIVARIVLSRDPEDLLPLL